MRILMLLPLSRFRVEYLVGAGRPFSEVDRLVLRAVGEMEKPMLHQLQELFRLPRRLLLEVLVTLMEEDWLAFDREGRFTLTARGEAANQGKEESRTMRTWPSSVNVWQEGYCGSLLAGPLDAASEFELKREQRGGVSVWDMAYRLKGSYGAGERERNPLAVRYGQNELDRGVVRQLLREPKEGWIQRITLVEPKGLGGSYYLPIGVDLETRTVTGLPDRWRRELAPEILEAAGRVPEDYLTPEVPWEYFEAEPEKPEAEVSSFVEDLADTAILGTAAEHEAQLVETLRAAREGDSILIAGTRLDAVAVLRFARPLAAALESGVHVDVLWGASQQAEAGPRDGAAAVAALLRALAPPSVAGRLRWNPAPARSNARMLLWVDATRAQCRAVVSSYDWLSAHGDGERHLGFRLANPGVIAELCQHAAAMLASGPRNELSGCSDRWSLLSGEMESRFFRWRMEAPELSNPARVRIVRDGTHRPVLRDLIGKENATLLTPSASSEAWVLGHLGKTAPAGLRVWSGAPRPNRFPEAIGWMESAGTAACGVLTKDAVLATNCNPLDAREPGTESRADIGVLVSLAGIGARCARRMEVRQAEARG